MVRQWIDGLADDEPLFPKLAQRKAYKMIQRDLQECGIAYETEEGIADFHAAGRHTHITRLLLSGVKLVEAKELARHSDVRMTMKYTHVGLEDQAKAVNLLPVLDLPAEETTGECLHNVSTPGGADGQDGARDGSDRLSGESSGDRRKSLPGREIGAEKQPVAPNGASRQKVEAAGIEPEAASTQRYCQSTTYGNGRIVGRKMAGSRRLAVARFGFCGPRPAEGRRGVAKFATMYPRGNVSPYACVKPNGQTSDGDESTRT